MGLIIMICLIVYVVGGIWFLYVAFNESISWGFACLLGQMVLVPLFNAMHLPLAGPLALVPFIPLAFLITHWHEAKKPFGMMILSNVLMVIIALIMVRGGRFGHGTESPVIVRPAPSFTLPDLNGKQVSLSDFEGKVVILDFWATWCLPCVKEIPHFIALYDEYGDQEVAMVGISTDNEDVSVVNSFVRKHRINYPILMADGLVQATYGGIRNIPTTFVIDQAGRIRYKYIGYRDKSVFETAIKTLLAGTESESSPAWTLNESSEVEDKKPSNLKTIGIALVVFILLGGIGVVTIKIVKDRSGGETYYEQVDEYVGESEEDAFGENDELPTAESLIADLQNEDPMVRNYAAVNLGPTGDKHAIKPLAKALKDEDQDVRKAAKESLIQILIKTLDDIDPHVRGTAAKALGKIGGKQGVSLLAKALKDEDEVVRTAAGEGLAMIKKKLGPEEWSKLVHKRE